MRNLLLLPFIIKSILGRDTSTFFFDEIRVAQALNFVPILLVSISLILGIVGVIYFIRRAYTINGIPLAACVITGGIFGFYVWSVLGPLILPGGPGIN